MRKSFLLCTLVSTGWLATAAIGGETSPRPSERIINGVLVSVADQQRLGLVTVGTGIGCSGTLLNRYWVLTADHCVTSNGAQGGPNASFLNLPITAAWSGRKVIPTRFVRNLETTDPTNPVDIALIFLGNGDFGAFSSPAAIGFWQPTNNTAVTHYGQGISAYAGFAPNGAPVPAQQDGRYRSAQFNLSNSGRTSYTKAANSAKQVPDGGDSGGADFFTDDKGVLWVIGVQSTCHFTACLSGKTCQASPGATIAWQWVTNIDTCNSAPVYRVRDRIVANFIATPCSHGAAACTIPEITQILLLQQ